jgi:hypothetical protein
MGLTRQLTALAYGDDLLVEIRPEQYLRANLQQDWRATERGPALYCQPATWLEVLALHTTHPASGDLKNEVSWSYSRAAKYSVCPRAYYYHYYAAWEGWLPTSPAPVQRAYLLKNLTDLPRWIGTLVHDSIKFALARLKAGQPVVGADLLKQMRVRAKADVENSRSGRYRQQPQPITGFQEHYYQPDYLSSAWEIAIERAESLLQTFIHSDLYADLCRQPAGSFLQIEELQSFTIAGTKVWVQLDLVRQVASTIYLYDWKTGATAEAELRLQLGLYGLFLRHLGLGDPAQAIQTGVYLLAQDQWVEFELDEPFLAQTQTQVEASIAQLRGLLLAQPANLAQLRRFPMIADLTVCRSCQFRELCGR